MTFQHFTNYFKILNCSSNTKSKQQSVIGKIITLKDFYNCYNLICNILIWKQRLQYTIGFNIASKGRKSTDFFLIQHWKITWNKDYFKLHNDWQFQLSQNFTFIIFQNSIYISDWYKLFHLMLLSNCKNFCHILILFGLKLF